MQKVLMVIYGALFIGIGIILFVQHQTIQKLKAAPNPAGQGDSKNDNSSSAASRAGNGSAPFSDMINAVNKNMKDLKIEATF